jgi:hypothetical protein
MITQSNILTSVAKVIILGGIMLCAHAKAQQSSLPPCPKWTVSENCKLDMTIPGGATISIEYVNGKPNGTAEMPNGDKYIGEFSKALTKHGFGKYLFADGKIYIGDWVRDSYEGHGIITWPSGKKYDGDFKEGKADGNGTLILPNGQVYKGQFKNGLRDGQGTETWPNGEKYVGEYREDKKSGQGTYTYPDGVKYVGQYIDDQKNGNGIYTTPNGDNYEGEFKDGQRNGWGTNIFPSGQVYAGEFKNNLRHGQGTQTFPNGEKYVGEYREDKKSGQGTYTYPNGEKYIGQFKDDRRNGWGTIVYVDGAKFIGEYRDGQRNGEGILFASDGRAVRMGFWANGQFIKQKNVNLPSNIVTEPAPLHKVSSGTAFRIANGQFVTNYHVINKCNTLQVGGMQNVSVFASDTVNDLALVSVPNDSGEIARIRTIRIQLNEAVTAAGFPLQGAFTGIAITNGTVSRLSGLKGDTGQVQISAPVQPGNSGGPLLDGAGNVIGVVSSKLNAVKFAGVTGDIPQNVNFAIGGNTLRAFLDAKGINYKEAGNERELTGVEIAAKASAFTVLVECR